MADFERAVERVLEHEGGYVFDPDDPGGETKFGISKRSYPDLDIKNLTVDQAKRIYELDWWIPMGLDEVEDQELAEKVFDMAVLMGRRRAVKLLQRALNAAGATLEEDGVIGPRTIGALNNHPNKRHVLAEFKLELVGYFLGLDRDKFLKGWLRRALS